MSKPVIALLFLAMACQADLVTSYTCSVQPTFNSPTAITVTNSTGCSLTGPNGTPPPSASALPLGNILPSGFGPTTSFSTTGIDGVVVMGSQGVQTQNPSLLLGAFAYASLSWTLSAISVGPVRPGIIEFSLSAEGEGGDGNGGALGSVSVGQYSTEASGTFGFCEGYCFVGYACRLPGTDL